MTFRSRTSLMHRPAPSERRATSPARRAACAPPTASGSSPCCARADRCRRPIWRAPAACRRPPSRASRASCATTGWLEDDDADAPARGRALALSRSAGVAVGIDFGHSHVRVAVADLAHTVLAEAEEPLDVDHEARRGRRARRAAGRARCSTRSAMAADRVTGVGMGLPARCAATAARSATRRSCPGWIGARPEALMQAELGLPVRVENDANLGALAEIVWGAGRGCAGPRLRQGRPPGSAPGSCSTAALPRRRRHGGRDRPHDDRRDRPGVPLRQPRLPGGVRRRRGRARAAAPPPRRRPHAAPGRAPGPGGRRRLPARDRRRGPRPRPRGRRRVQPARPRARARRRRARPGRRRCCSSRCATPSAARPSPPPARSRSWPASSASAPRSSARSRWSCASHSASWPRRAAA